MLCIHCKDNEWLFRSEFAMSTKRKKTRMVNKNMWQNGRLTGKFGEMNLDEEKKKHEVLKRKEASKT